MSIVGQTEKSTLYTNKIERLTVSVVIVTWNRKSDLLNAINSLNEQSLKPDQIIVVDNGSSDGTVMAATQEPTKQHRI